MSSRLLRVNQLIKKELSQIILREIDFSKDVLVTLTRVETVPNLSESKIYVSCIPDGKQEDVLKTLISQVWHLQQLLNKRLKMRPIPKIIFLKEKETVKAGKIEEILEKIKNNG